MRKIFATVGTVLAFGIAGVAFAQTALPEGVTDEQMNSALKDLSAVYGASVVRLDQAKAICNEEQYVVDCAEIGKKYDLFSDARTKQVDALLTEFKGEIVEKMKQCENVACLVDVACSFNEIENRLVEVTQMICADQSFQFLHEFICFIFCFLKIKYHLNANGKINNGVKITPIII